MSGLPERNDISREGFCPVFVVTVGTCQVLDPLVSITYDKEMNRGVFPVQIDSSLITN